MAKPPRPDRQGIATRIFDGLGDPPVERVGLRGRGIVGGSTVARDPVLTLWAAAVAERLGFLGVKRRSGAGSSLTWEWVGKGI